MLRMMRAHFETDENRQFYLSEWRETRLQRIIDANPTVSRTDCLQMLFDKLQEIQRGLAENYQTDSSIRDQVVSACQGIPECSLALYQPATTFEAVCVQLRSAVGTAVQMQGSDIRQFPAKHQESPSQERSMTRTGLTGYTGVAEGDTVVGPATLPPVVLPPNEVNPVFGGLTRNATCVGNQLAGQQGTLRMKEKRPTTSSPIRGWHSTGTDSREIPALPCRVGRCRRPKGRRTSTG